MDPTNLLTKLYLIRNQLLFFWQNPAVFKMELLADRQLLTEVIMAIIIFFILIFVLIKPPKNKNELKTSEAKKPHLPTPSPQNKPASKTFSRALRDQQERQGEPALHLRSSRPVSKNSESIPVQDLTVEEEQALQQAMSIAGKQALADATGAPLQTEIFEHGNTAEVAKKIFAGEVKSSQTEKDLHAGAEPGAFEFIMIYFMAPRSQAFDSEVIFAMLRELGLYFNDQHVFEYTDEGGIQFYVSSAMKPGRFDLHHPHYPVPGLSFVLDLATLTHPEPAFHKMLSCINEISERLQGDILDEYRQRLTQSTIYQYTARIRAYQR